MSFFPKISGHAELMFILSLLKNSGFCFFHFYDGIFSGWNVCFCLFFVPLKLFDQWNYWFILRSYVRSVLTNDVLEMSGPLDVSVELNLTLFYIQDSGIPRKAHWADRVSSVITPRPGDSTQAPRLPGYQVTSRMWALQSKSIIFLLVCIYVQDLSFFVLLTNLQKKTYKYLINPYS